MASDIFNVAPPEWFTRIAQPVNGREIGSLVGTLASGAQIAARDDKPFMQGVAESRMNQRDPMWKLKELKLNSEIKAYSAQIASHIMADKIRQKTLDDEMADQLATTQLITTAGGDNDKMLQGLATLPLKSGRWQNNAAQMRLAIVALKSKDAATKAMSKLSPQALARVSQYNMGSPEWWNAVETEGAKMDDAEVLVDEIDLGGETAHYVHQRGKGGGRVIRSGGLSDVDKIKLRAANSRYNAAVKSLQDPRVVYIPSAKAEATAIRDAALAEIQSFQGGATPAAATTSTTPPAQGASSTNRFNSEQEARAGGAKAGDEVYLIGIGRVKLK